MKLKSMRPIFSATFIKPLLKFNHQIKHEVGDIEILVNNAGIVNAKYLDEITEDEIQNSFDINIMAHFWVLN